MTAASSVEMTGADRLQSAASIHTHKVTEAALFPNEKPGCLGPPSHRVSHAQPYYSRQ